MSLSPNTPVPDARISKPAAFGVGKPYAKTVKHFAAPELRVESKAAATLEYENPDLTRPSVSSF